jgi:hypothetical protein
MAKRKKKKSSKKCRDCGKRRAIENFQPHTRTKDGFRHVCRDCQTTTAGRKRTGNGKLATPVTDAKINAILASVETAVGSQLMPVVNTVVRAMREVGASRLVIDIHKGYVEIPTPERFALPEEKE